MANEDFTSDWGSALNQIQNALGAKSAKYGERAGMALDLLEVSLDTLAELGLLTKVAVDFCGCTSEGKRIERKYVLGRKSVKADDEYFDEVTYIKKSVLEEDE